MMNFLETQDTELFIQYFKKPVYLNIKMNRIKSEKKVATLSIVLSITTNCLLSAGMKRMSFNIRNKRNVRNTEMDCPLVEIPFTSSGFTVNTSYTLNK